MPTTGFEPTFLASKRPQTYALDRAANGINPYSLIEKRICEDLQFLQPCRFSRGAGT
jgi:hypothetical protein